jgi:hypothetical protein
MGRMASRAMVDGEVSRLGFLKSNHTLLVLTR